MDIDSLAARIYEYSVAKRYVVSSPNHPKWVDVPDERRARWLRIAEYIITYMGEENGK